MTRHKDYQAFVDYLETTRDTYRIFACTTKTTGHHVDAHFTKAMCCCLALRLGLLHSSSSMPMEQRIRIPMMPDARSLNLSNAVVIAFEAWRQMDWRPISFTSPE